MNFSVKAVQLKEKGQSRPTAAGGAWNGKNLKYRLGNQSKPVGEGKVFKEKIHTAKNQTITNKYFL